MKTISFPDGATVPALGQGTWMMAEDAASSGSGWRARLGFGDADLIVALRSPDMGSAS